MEHKDIPEAGLHEPKGVSTAVSGTAYIADGEGSGSWQNPIPADIMKVGFADYQDYATSLSPQAISATTWTQLTNDALGSRTTEVYLPSGVGSLWNSSTDQMDLSDLTVGSTFDIRVDVDVTTSAANQYIALKLTFGVGDPEEFSITIASDHIKTAGTYNITRYMGVFIGSSLMTDNPGEI